MHRSGRPRRARKHTWAEEGGSWGSCRACRVCLRRARVTMTEPPSQGSPLSPHPNVFLTFFCDFYFSRNDLAKANRALGVLGGLQHACAPLRTADRHLAGAAAQWRTQRPAVRRVWPQRRAGNRSKEEGTRRRTRGRDGRGGASKYPRRTAGGPRRARTPTCCPCLCAGHGVCRRASSFRAWPSRRWRASPRRAPSGRAPR